MTEERSERRILQDIERKVESLMASVEEVTAVLTTLTTDLEAVAAAAKAEFAKLEEELAAAKVEVNLTPLKETIESIDAKVKAVEVPTA